MLQIIRRLARDDSPLYGITENKDTKEQSLDHQFSHLWDKILKHGWSDHNTTMGIDRLYNIGGAAWLVTALIKVQLDDINYNNHLLKRKKVEWVCWSYTLKKRCVDQAVFKKSVFSSSKFASVIGRYFSILTYLW